MANNGQIARNTLFLYIRMVVVMCISLYTTRLILQVLGVDDYGIYSVVCGFVSMLGFLNTSITNATQRYYNYQIGQGKVDSVKNVFTSALLIQVLLCGIIVVLGETVGLWYIENKLVLAVERQTAALWVYQFSILTVCVTLFQTPYSAAVMAFEKMNFYAIISIIDALLKLIIVVLLNYCEGDKLIYYGLMLFLVSLVSWSLYVLFVTSKIKCIKLSFPISTVMLKSILSFSGWNVFSSCSNIVSGQGVNILLNTFFGPVVNASRGVANQIMSAIQYFSANIIVAFRPQLIQSYSAGEYSRTNFLLFSMSKISFVLMLVIALPIVIEIEQILNLWLGDNVPEYTAVFSSLVIISMLINILNSPISIMAHATGNIRRYELVYGLITASILPISYLFLKVGYSAEIVYVINIFIVVLNQVCCIINLKRLYPLNLRDYFRNVIFPCLIMSLISPILPLMIHSMMPESFVRIFFVFIVSLISVLIAFIMFLSKDEKLLMHNLLKKIRK